MTEILESAATASQAGRALCADVSRAHSEPLGATASRVDHWLLVEYRGLWTRDSLGGSSLGERVKEHLRGQLRALPNSRLLFIRRPDRRGAASRALYFGRSLEGEQRFFSLEIERYDDLLGLDFAGALAGGRPVGVPVAHPLLVACTHGKRDRCCAKYGRPLYDELREQAEPDWVWQSTHVGGDRFAGNLVCLPEGLYFGRVERPDVWPLLDEYLAGRIALDHYRGRSCYPFPVQAAERRIREETGLTGLEDLALASFRRTREASWSVAFHARATGVLHEADVAAALADDPTYLTCSSAAPARPRRFLATAHRIRGQR